MYMIMYKNTKVSTHVCVFMCSCRRRTRLMHHNLSRTEHTAKLYIVMMVCTEASSKTHGFFFVSSKKPIHLYLTFDTECKI